MNKKSYSEMIKYKTKKERIDYLFCGDKVGEKQDNKTRRLLQQLYRSDYWKDEIRPMIITRDSGCDLSLPDEEIISSIYIHHINPITVEDVLSNSSNLYDPENLICVSRRTHDMIHYGYDDVEFMETTQRYPNDTCPWR